MKLSTAVGNSQKLVHLPGFNGIRAIAAMPVVVTHLIQDFGYFGLTRRPGLEMAGFGVTIFFTLSGFLITYLLLQEKEEFGNINIKQFYLRRILRIWPLYFFYLSISVVTLLVYGKEYLNSNIVYYVIMLENIPLILGTQLPVLHHFWSLAVEEQFYLFWPWIIKRVTRLKFWITGLIFFLFIAKIIFWVYYRKSGNGLPLSAIHITRFHCMALGALAAILCKENNKLFMRVSFHISIQLLVWATLFILAFNKFYIADLINDEVISLISVFLIVNVSMNPGSLIKLNNRYLSYIGKISFGIYVYHPLVIYLTALSTRSILGYLSLEIQYITVFALVIFGTIIIAHLSYKYFESPFLRLKDRFARIKSSAYESSKKAGF